MLHHFCLLRLENGGNQSVIECRSKSLKAATEIFVALFPVLNVNGYCKQGEVSWCVAEQI